MVLSHIRQMVILSTCIFHIWLLRTCTVGRRSPAAILRYHGNKSWTLTFSAILLGDIHVSVHILAIIRRRLTHCRLHPVYSSVISYRRLS